MTPKPKIKDEVFFPDRTVVDRTCKTRYGRIFNIAQRRDDKGKYTNIYHIRLKNGHIVHAQQGQFFVVPPKKNVVSQS